MARTARFPQAEARSFSHEWHEQHDFRKRKTRSFLHEWHEQHDFRKRKHDLSCHSCLKNRVIDLSISYHSCHSCSQKIVSSTCRHRIIRAIRASKNRAIDLSISCHSCFKKSCYRLVDIVSFVSFVLQKNRVIDLSISCHSCHSCSKKIVSSTCRYRIIRVIRALKYRVIDWSISCHSCLKISCHRLVDIVAFVSFVQDGIETFVPTKP